MNPPETSSIDEIITQTAYMWNNRHETPEIELLQSSITIAAKVISEKKHNLGALKASLLQAWRPLKKVEINTLDTNLLVFIFSDRADGEKVLDLSPWTFHGNHVVTKIWDPNIDISQISFQSSQFWLKCYNIPVLLTNLASATSIGNVLGNFIKAELKTEKDKWKGFLKIRVELPLDKPLIDSIRIIADPNLDFLSTVRYERLPELCFSCGCINHRTPNCKIPNQSPSRFGLWLKADKLDIENPKKNLSPAQSTDIPIFNWKKSVNSEISPSTLDAGTANPTSLNYQNTPQRPVRTNPSPTLADKTCLQKSNSRPTQNPYTPMIRAVASHTKNLNQCKPLTIPPIIIATIQPTTHAKTQPTYSNQPNQLNTRYKPKQNQNQPNLKHNLNPQFKTPNLNILTNRKPNKNKRIINPINNPTVKKIKIDVSPSSTHFHINHDPSETQQPLLPNSEKIDQIPTFIFSSSSIKGGMHGIKQDQTPSHQINSNQITSTTTNNLLTPKIKKHYKKKSPKTNPKLKLPSLSYIQTKPTEAKQISNQNKNPTSNTTEMQQIFDSKQKQLEQYSSPTVDDANTTTPPAKLNSGKLQAPSLGLDE